MDWQRQQVKKFFVTLPLSLGYVAFGLRPQSTPPRDRTRLVNPIQRKSKQQSANISNRVNQFQERTSEQKGGFSYKNICTPARIPVLLLKKQVHKSPGRSHLRPYLGSRSSLITYINGYGLYISDLFVYLFHIPVFIFVL